MVILNLKRWTIIKGFKQKPDRTGGQNITCTQFSYMYNIHHADREENNQFDVMLFY